MLDTVNWIEDFWPVERKLFENCNHFINVFQLHGELSWNQIQTLRNRLLHAGRNIQSLASLQRDIIAFRDILRWKALTENQLQFINEWMNNTYFFECIKVLGITEKEIYMTACAMLREAMDIVSGKELQDIAIVAEWIQLQVQTLLNNR